MDVNYIWPTHFCRLTYERFEGKEFNCCETVRPKRKERHRALLAACFLLVSHLTYSSTLMIEAVRSSGSSGTTVDTY
jgi:hypothetical protein